MYQVLKQMANDNGLSIEDTNRIFTAFSGIIVNKIPQLKQVITDVFTNADDELLQEHINRSSALIQQQESDKHKTHQSSVWDKNIHRIRFTERGELF